MARTGTAHPAIRRGRVRLVTRPLSWVHVARFVVGAQATRMLFRDGVRYMGRIVRRTRNAAAHPTPTPGPAAA